MLTRYRTPAYIDFRKREFAKILEQIPVAQREGVRFLAGTDTTIAYIYPGFSLHEEPDLFVKVGLTPMEALQTATINPIRSLREESDARSIEKGKLAGLLLLDADPLADIRNTRRIAAVVRGGKLLRRGDLDALLQEAERMATTRTETN
jgi:imidazolonepropionase-like amidohydrolase